jgi:hypothetical protein
LSTDAARSRLPGPDGRVLLASGVALAALGATLMRSGWGHQPDVLIDFGRELYLAWRLCEGEVLQRDLRHLSGPLSAYWNALVFQLLGVGLHGLIWVNAGLLACLAWLAHALLLRLAGPLSAFVGTAVLLVAFGFQQAGSVSNYNYLTPYAHELTHGLLLSLLTLRLLCGPGRGGPIRDGVAGGLLGAVALTKPEVFVALAGAVAVHRLLVLRAERASLWAGRAGVGRLLLGTCLAPLAAVSALGSALPPDQAFAALADPWRFALDPGVRDLDFYRRGLGTLDLTASLARILRWGTVWALFVGGITWLAWRLPLGRGAALAVAALLGLAALVWLDPQPATRWLMVTTPLPFAVAAWLAVAVWRTWRAAPGESSDDDRLRIACGVFALLLLAKIALRAGIGHYGFALAMPVALLAVAALCDRIPGWIEARGGRGVLLRGAALGAIGALGLGLLQVRAQLQTRQRHPVGTGADAFLADARGVYVSALLEQLRATTPADATLLVLPEGVMINYLARRRNPTPYLNFMPPELLLFGEAEMLRAFERDPPDYVALVHKSTREYGPALFGVDYGQRLRAFVDRDYRVVSRIGDPPLTPDARFGITLHRRRGVGEWSPAPAADEPHP